MGMTKYAYTDSEPESATAEVKVPLRNDKPRRNPKYNTRSSTRRTSGGKHTVAIKLTPKTKTANRSDTPPSEWRVDQVVEWLKSNGLGEDVCDKFIDHDITGEALFELDVNILKTEIGIEAFGKRTRIANAIAKLRSPPGHHPQRSDSVTQSVSLALENPNPKADTSSTSSLTSEPASGFLNADASLNSISQNVGEKPALYDTSDKILSVTKHPMTNALFIAHKYYDRSAYVQLSNYTDSCTRF